MELVSGFSPLADLLRMRSDFMSSNVAEASRQVNVLTGNRSHFTLASGFQQVSGLTRRLGSTSINFVRWQGGAEATSVMTNRIADLVNLHIPVQGEFELAQHDFSERMVPGQISLASLVGESWTSWRGASGLINLTFTTASLHNVLKAEFGIVPKAELRFDRHEVKDVATAQSVYRLVEFICHDIASERMLWSSDVLGQKIERSLLMLVLMNFHSNFSDAIGKAENEVSPFYVRRVKTHIRDHMHLDITIEKLAAEADVSVRTLQYGFKRFCGVSPMRYLKHARMTAARSVATSASDDDAIAAFAAAIGYRSFDHFSRDYRAYFGEAPTRTARRY